MNKRSVLWIIVGVALVVLAVTLYLSFAQDGEVQSSNSRYLLSHTAPSISDSYSEMRKTVDSHLSKNSKKRKRRAGKFMDGVDRSMFAHFSEEDKKLAEVVQEALDADDADKTIKAATKLMNSSNPEARSHAVDALGWFGLKALPELTMLMGDSNEDVAQNAVNAWESGFSEIDNVQTRLKVSAMALNALSSIAEIKSSSL